MLFKLVLIIQLVVCLGLVLFILLQKGKGVTAGMGFSGSPQGAFGVSSGASVMTRTTAILGVLFFSLSVILSALVLSDNSANRSLMQEFETQQPEQDAIIPAIPE